MMSAMLFLIEIASMLKVVSDFLHNKNQDVDMDVLYMIDNALSSGDIAQEFGLQLVSLINGRNNTTNNQMINLSATD